jgi:hypothetical protein
MTDNFEYQCRRRLTRRHTVIEEAIVNEKRLLGAGSGGDGTGIQYAEGEWGGDGTAVHVTARGLEETPDLVAVDPVIALLAAGTADAKDGLVTVRGSRGVRITAGPHGEPEAMDDDTDGVEIQVDDSQYVTIMRGLDSNDAHGLISMSKGGLGSTRTRAAYSLRATPKSICR